jgi:hypothetical protein
MHLCRTLAFVDAILAGPIIASRGRQKVPCPSFGVIDPDNNDAPFTEFTWFA